MRLWCLSHKVWGKNSQNEAAYQQSGPAVSISKQFNFHSSLSWAMEGAVKVNKNFNTKGFKPLQEGPMMYY